MVGRYIYIYIKYKAGLSPTCGEGFQLVTKRSHVSAMSSPPISLRPTTGASRTYLRESATFET